MQTTLERVWRKPASYIFRELVDHESVLLLSSIGATTNGFLILFWNPSSHFDDFAETLNPLEANTRTTWIRFSCVVCSCHKEIADYFPRSWVFVWEERNGWQSRRRRRDPPVVIGTPLLANKQEGKVNFRKKQSEIFRRDNFNLNCSWCDNCACAEAVCPC